MGRDIEIAPTRTSEDVGSLKTPTKVGRGELAEIIPPHDSYEGRHRYDLTATWTDAEEKRVVFKTDLFLLSWLCVMMFGLQLDRGNLSNALTDKLLDDLHLTTDDYNNGTTIQLVCFLAAEFPVQLLTKRFGFCLVLPIVMFAWGTVSWAQAWIHDRTSFYITRALIGACEGGFIPGVILFATYFYKSKELAIRLAAFWSTLNVSRIISALLAAGILEMRGINGKPGWFWLFLLEGLLTVLIAIVSLLYLPSSPVGTKGVLFRQGWYTEREEVIMVNVSFYIIEQLSQANETSASSATIQPKVLQICKSLLRSRTSKQPGAIPLCGDSTSSDWLPIFLLRRLLATYH